jgi:hypothetical protein
MRQNSAKESGDVATIISLALALIPNVVNLVSDVRLLDIKQGSHPD